MPLWTDLVRDCIEGRQGTAPWSGAPVCRLEPWESPIRRQRGPESAPVLFWGETSSLSWGVDPVAWAPDSRQPVPRSFSRELNPKLYGVFPAVAGPKARRTAPGHALGSLSGQGNGGACARRLPPLPQFGAFVYQLLQSQSLSL